MVRDGREERTEERQEQRMPLRNRDVARLTRVLYAMQDVSAAEKKREWMQDRLYSITQKITGMPGGRGGDKGLETSFAMISEMEERYARECEEFVQELREAEKILNAIPDRGMRTFVVMRYVMHMGRKEIMGKLNMKRWKFQQACARVEQAEEMAQVQWFREDEY